jgi:Domain of unknown function(DUF2779)
MKETFISKSKFMEGERCSKLFWYEYNAKKMIPPPDPMSLAVMEEGKKVGALARTLYPDGTMIGFDFDFRKMHERSVAALKTRKPLFEAGFIHDHEFAIADILLPVEDDKWDIVEVKSSSEAKEEHKIDVAFQKHTYQGAGLKIRKCFIMHINNQYVKQGPIEADKLFMIQDVSEDVQAILPGMREEIEHLLKTIDQEKEPDVKIGAQCRNPRECPLKDVLCWKGIPEDSVFVLYRGGKFLYDLYEKGVMKVEDIPLTEKLNEKQLIQIASHKKNEEYVNKEEISEFMANFKYPLYFLDFETIAPVLPIYDGTRPYEAVPFQYSLHIIEKDGDTPKHYSYIAPGNVDPRLEVLKRLKELLKDKGSIIAYNAIFEIRCLKVAGEAYKEYRDYANSLEARFVDLMTPFLKFYYYSPKQMGSYSIKYVLPALTGKSYDGLEIANGEVANREYARVTFDTNTTDADKKKVYDALEIYCELDTQGMIDVWEALKKKI